MTDAENLLWYHLRARRLDGLKFRRQHPIPPYITDFHCHEAMLVVELDGSQHCAEADAMRSQFLERQGFRILRFWDNDVLQSPDHVLDVILWHATSRRDARDAVHVLDTPTQESP